MEVPVARNSIQVDDSIKTNQVDGGEVKKKGLLSFLKSLLDFTQSSYKYNTCVVLIDNNNNELATLTSVTNYLEDVNVLCGRIPVLSFLYTILEPITNKQLEKQLKFLELIWMTFESVTEDVMTLSNNERVAFYIRSLKEQRKVKFVELELIAALLGGRSVMTKEGEYLNIGYRIIL